MTEAAQGIIHALLVDDHALFREAVAGALRGTPDLQVEHCGSIREALSILVQRHFDLVLLDHDLGNERAWQFLPAACQAGFNGPVLIVTAWVSDTEARRLIRQGVAGIFLKEEPLASLIESIRAVASGGRWLGSYFQHRSGDAPTQAAAGVPLFNEWHRKALRLVLAGLSNKEIAWRLQVSESYVKAIMQSLFRKTGVRTRGQLVRVVFEQYEDQL
ncbi:MAG: response regulator transcription factor [Bryobacteraceae bacterium]|jgi:DNA-binding NarL/FixJ family response regulator